MSLRRFAAVLARKDQRDSRTSYSSNSSSSFLGTLSIPKRDTARQSEDKSSSNVAWPEPSRQSPYSSATAKASSISLPEQSTSAPPKVKSQRSFTGSIPRTASLPSADDFSLPSTTTMHKARTSVSTLFSKATSSVSSLFDDVSVEGSSDGRGKWAKWRGGKTKAKPQAQHRSWDFLERSRAASPLDNDTDDDDASSISSEASFLQSVPSGPQADQESAGPSAIPAVYLPRSHTNLHALTLHSLNYRPSPHPLFNLSSQSKFPRSCNPSRALSQVPSLRSNLAKTRVLDKLEAQQLTPSENESILPFGRRSLPKPPQDPEETEELKRLSNDGSHSAGLHIWCTRSSFLRRVVQWGETETGAEARSPALPKLFSEVQVSNGLRALAGLGPHQTARRYPVLLSPVDEDETIGGILPPLDRQDINGQLLSLLQLPSLTPSNASSSPPLTPESISPALNHSLSVEFPEAEEPDARRSSSESSAYDEPEPTRREPDMLFAMETAQALSAISNEPESEPVPEAEEVKPATEAESQPVRDECPVQTTPAEVTSAELKDETRPATATRSRTLRRVAGEPKLNDGTKFLQPRLSQVTSFWPPSSRSPALENETASFVSEPMIPSSKRPELRSQRSVEDIRPVSRSLAATFDKALPNPALATPSRRIPTAKPVPSSPSTRRSAAADIPPVPTSPLTTSKPKSTHRRTPSTSGGDDAPPAGPTQTRHRSNSAPKVPPPLSSSPRVDALYLSTAEGRIIRKVNSAAKVSRSPSVSAAQLRVPSSSSRDYGTPPSLPRRSEDSQRITTRVNRTLPLPSTSLPSFTDPRLSRQPEPWNDYPDPNLLYRPAALSSSGGLRRM